MPAGPNALNFEELAEAAQRSLDSGKGHHRPGLEWLAPVVESNQVTTPSHDALLVGPADRYEVGEMLRPHVLTRVLNFSRFRCAGLVSADLTSVGGHSVRTYGESALEMTGQNLHMVHFGGETLSQDIVDGYRAAITGDEEERFESLAVLSEREQITDYVRRRTGQLDDFGYLLAAEGEFYGSQTSFHAVSLSDPDSIPEEAKERLFALLRKADFLGVRDENGANFLEGEGLPVHRMPCALSVLPQVCPRQLRSHRDNKSLEEMRHRFPNGWIAVEVGQVQDGQFEKLSAALREVAERESLGLVFFDASHRGEHGPAPSTRRWVEAFPEWIGAGFASSNIWEVASMLLHSRLYCGSCLDCRIICMSGGVARLNIPTGSEAALSYCELWEHDDVPIEFSEDEPWVVALKEALDVDLSILQEHAASLHRSYFESLEAFCAATGLYPRLMQGRDAEEVTPHQAAAAAMHHLHDEWLNDEESLKKFRKLNRWGGRRTRQSMRSRIIGKFSRKRESV